MGRLCCRGCRLGAYWPGSWPKAFSTSSTSSGAKEPENLAREPRAPCPVTPACTANPAPTHCESQPAGIALLHPSLLQIWDLTLTRLTEARQCREERDCRWGLQGTARFCSSLRLPLLVICITLVILQTLMVQRRTQPLGSNAGAWKVIIEDLAEVSRGHSAREGPNRGLSTSQRRTQPPNGTKGGQAATEHVVALVPAHL